MRTITHNIKVELASAERAALNQTRAILDSLLEIMKDKHCSSTYFEDIGVEFTTSEIQSTLGLIDVLADENPIIE